MTREPEQGYREPPRRRGLTAGHYLVLLGIVVVLVVALFLII